MKIDIKTSYFLIAAVAIAAIIRFIPAPPNFSAFGAVAIASGALLSRKWVAYIITFGGLFLSDVIMNNIVYAHVFDGFVWFDSTSWGRYLSYGLIILTSALIVKKVSVKSTIASSVAAVALFFVISNFAVWTSGLMYPKTAIGLIEAYTMAIPFLGWNLVSTLVFVGAFFGAYELLLASKLRSQKA